MEAIAEALHDLDYSGDYAWRSSKTGEWTLWPRHRDRVCQRCQRVDLRSLSVLRRVRRLQAERIAAISLAETAHEIEAEIEEIEDSWGD